MRQFALCFLILAADRAEGQQRPAQPAEETSRFVRGFDATVREGFDRVRAATARFVSLDSAVASGYAGEVAGCLQHSQHGGMGFHHVNSSYVDVRLMVERPEILVYERLPNGAYALNGVEYIIPYRLWPRDSLPPTIMGQALKRSDELRLWYLHMWIWKENPSGLFADWNPLVMCRER